jgi:hypothetical protein
LLDQRLTHAEITERLRTWAPKAAGEPAEAGRTPSPSDELRARLTGIQERLGGLEEAL